MALTAYSMADVSATVDGSRVVGLWDGDDAISVEQAEDVGEILIGADGDGIFSHSINYSAKIMLRLQPTSDTHRLLTEKWKKQRDATNVTAFQFTVSNRQTDEGGTGPRCFIMTAPKMQFGKNASVREWTLIAERWEPTSLNVAK